MPPRTQAPRARTLKEQRTIDMKRRDADMWRMRRQGKTTEQIAEHYDLSPATIQACLNRAADAYQLEEASALVKLELDRLDSLLRTALKVLNNRHLAYSHGRLLKTEDGEPVTDSAPVLQALDRVLKIMDQRSKYLGLYAPTKSEQIINVHKHDTTDLALQELINEFNAQAATLTPESLTNNPTTPNHNTNAPNNME